MAQVAIERSTMVEVTQPSMRWGAIIAGWLVAVGIAFLLYVGGLAMGFTAFDPNDAQATAKGIGMGTAAWLVLTWVVSLLIGGMFASWFDGRDDETTGVMHGVTVWGLSIAASGLLLALGMGGAIGSGANLVAAGAGMNHHSRGWDADSAHGSLQMGNNATILLQAQLSQKVRAARSTALAAPMSASGAPMPDMQNGATLGAASARGLDPKTAGAATMALLADHPDTAKALLAANTDMSPANIDATVQSLSPQVSEAQATLKAAADKTAHYAAMAMWVLFLSIVLSLLAAALGGWLGASHVHRVYHLRRYTRSVPLR
ncbi:hypothetical protein PY254_14385 [Rhodanobacter sp. AS-Z3]|uniref:hypothetical protein n=1 Tax=Rhodanobacter sp. AS-Z3 TaxID=3031330 RepID=UPI00247B2490|nr:hypothetical protein [Rhodanobacter sp. AS-Z3]WEN14410.1 hypothetical protein PY254_14385 [Rhodanobacter sp. AS-Z3]